MRRPGPARLVRVGAGVLALLAAGCTGPNGSNQAIKHRVKYALTWKADQWREHDDTGDRVLVNDLGYTIRLTRGYVVTRSTELVECPKTALSGLLALPMQLIAALAAPRAAYAGHSTGTPNPAAINIPRVESLTDAQSSIAGEVWLAPQVYCQVHYLIARADNNTVNLPHDPDMVDVSLHVEGTYRARGAAEEKPFLLRTTVANGRLFDLFPAGHVGDAAAKFRLDTGHDGADVVIRRDLDHLFSGVDFVAMPERLVVRQILQNMIDTLQIEVNRSPDL